MYLGCGFSLRRRECQERSGTESWTSLDEANKCPLAHHFPVYSVCSDERKNNTSFSLKRKCPQLAGVFNRQVFRGFPRQNSQWRLSENCENPVSKRWWFQTWTFTQTIWEDWCPIWRTCVHFFSKGSFNHQLAHVHVYFLTPHFEGSLPDCPSHFEAMAVEASQL